MARGTSFKKGVRFNPKGLWAANAPRPMTFVNTTYVTSAAASGTYGPTTLASASCGGLDNIVGGWAEARQEAAATSAILVNCVPLDDKSGLVLNYIDSDNNSLYGSRAATIDVLILGYQD